MVAVSGLFTNEYTDMIQKVVRQVVNDPATYLGSKYLPSLATPATRIYVDVVEASGGLTNEHVEGTDPKTVQGIGTHTQSFEGGVWKEELVMVEKDLLRLRELGQNDRSMRGARRYIDLNVDKLNRRLEARMEKLRWDTIFSGGWSYLGRTVSFGVPGGNQVTPVGDDWSADGDNADNNADPVKDLRWWLFGGEPLFRKYKVSKIVSNPNTARWVLDNENVQSLIKSRFSAENFSDYDLNKSLQFLIPGLPPWEVYNGWYQSETVTNNVVSVGDATYFIPDGYLFFEVSNLPGGDVLGEMVQGVHLASGSVDTPGFGKYIVIEDNTAPGTKGGPQNPYISMVAGFRGGAKLDRPFDVLTAKVYGN